MSLDKVDHNLNRLLLLKVGCFSDWNFDQNSVTRSRRLHLIIIQVPHLLKLVRNSLMNLSNFSCLVKSSPATIPMIRSTFCALSYTFLAQSAAFPKGTWVKKEFQKSSPVICFFPTGILEEFWRISDDIWFLNKHQLFLLPKAYESGILLEFFKFQFKKAGDFA